MFYPKLTSLVYLSMLIFSLLAFTIADDAAFMSKLAKALSNPSGWASSSSFCMWDGVACDSSDRVTSINLASNSLSGTLPSDLNSLSQLTSLSLQNNALSGPLPSLANLSSLQTVLLDFNNFAFIPDGCFQGLISLQTLGLSNNPNLAPWSFPTDLAQSSYLEILDLGTSNLAGSLPDIFDFLPSLKSIRLSYNKLTGEMPASFKGSGIVNLWLNMNGLSGRIDVLSSMNGLSQVWLHQNQFTGPISNLSECKNLFDLQLRDNMFTGTVPPSLMNDLSLQNISLDNNKLQGPMPQFGKGVRVTLDENSFCKTSTGSCDDRVTMLLEIAAGFGYPIKLANSWNGNDPCNDWSFIVCTDSKITTVNMVNQTFGGTISSVFANLTDLRNLYLSGNNLTGTIPESLTTLPQLEILDASNNNLSGKVPKFSSKVKLITTGNHYLVNTSGFGVGGNGSSPRKGSHSSSLSSGWIAGIVIIVLFLVGVLLIISFKCYAGIPCDLNGQSSSNQSDLHDFEGGSASISIQVLRQVTNNFNEDNILGRGGSGVVYKGEFRDGTKIAVKRMESIAMGSKGLKEFQAEISVLSKVRHRHLVALLGYCINGNERLLVYEYMPQGTLTQHLFDWREKGFAPLTWKQRLVIALDVARGVQYLHSLAQQSFIHRDLKPSNILLSDGMRAKVSDFGLVKNIAADVKHSVETRVAGTFGYLDPEYGATGRVTAKADVYSFGVVLMELMTAKRAVDDSISDEGSHLVSWFRKVLINKDNIPNVIDQTLDIEEETTLESIYKVAELAGNCTAHKPHQRPDMSHTVNVLAPLVEQWKPMNQREGDDEGDFGSDTLTREKLMFWSL